VQKCNECRRLEGLLQESDRDYLAATNRYNTLLLTGLEKSWAGQALRTAKMANDERQRQFDEHVKMHTPDRHCGWGLVRKATDKREASARISVAVAATYR
jgi:hypothetical protein